MILRVAQFILPNLKTHDPKSDSDRGSPTARPFSMTGLSGIQSAFCQEKLPIESKKKAKLTALAQNSP